MTHLSWLRTLMKLQNAALLPLFLFSLLCYPPDSCATPLLAMQAAERCDTCHVRPDPKDPKWLEENYKIAERKCRLSCGVCHVDPSGGMLRNETGFYFGTKTLPWRSDVFEPLQAALWGLKSTRILDLGGDLRHLFYAVEQRDNNPFSFLMQADMYARLHLFNHLTLLGQFGVEQSRNESVKEVMGIVDHLPYNAYLKAGMFVPPFGHKLDDHTAFVRSLIALDHSQPEAYLTGVEVGAEPLVFFGRLASFNDDTIPDNSGSSQGRHGYSGVAGWQGLWLQLGGSYLEIQNFSPNFDRKAHGIFGALRWQSLTYLYEFDVRRDVFRTREREARLSFNELNYKIVNGLNLKMRYESFNPDAGPSTIRYLAGLDLHPVPFLEFNLQYRINREEPKRANNEFYLLSHLWF